MHLIRHCSICGNKCGRLSDSVPSRHVSSPLPARLPPAFLSSTLSSPLNAAVQFLWFPPDSLAPPLSLLLCQHGPLSSSTALLISSLLLTTLIIHLSSQQISTLSNSFLSLYAKLPLLLLVPLSPACVLIVFHSSPPPTYIAHTSAWRRRVRFEKLRLIQQCVRQKLLLIKNVMAL